MLRVGLPVNDIRYEFSTVSTNYSVAVRISLTDSEREVRRTLQYISHI